MNKIIYWLPRILAIGFIIFLSLFALDVFSEYSGWDAVLPMFMHLLPMIALAIVTAIAWRYELFGAGFFLAAALYYVFLMGTGAHWSVYLLIPFPCIVIAVLFFFNWKQKNS
jgi:hypothetical protein